MKKGKQSSKPFQEKLLTINKLNNFFINTDKNALTVKSIKKTAFRFDGLPVTANKLYKKSGKNKFYLTEEYTGFIQYVYLKTLNVHFHPDPKSALGAIFVFHSPRWVTATGAIANMDVDNRIKTLNDALIKRFKTMDDRNFITQKIYKMVTDESEYTDVYLFELDEGNFIL